MSRAAQLDCQHLRSCALVLTLFLFQKGQGFFPPLPIAALLRHSWRWAYLPLAGWDVSKWLVGFAALVSGRGFFSQLAWGQAYPLAGWDVFLWLGYFCSTKGQREVKITLAFIASHEARRRMAVYTMQLAGSRTRPASREACRRAAVASQPSCMSHEHPAPYGRGVGCRAARGSVCPVDTTAAGG